MEHGLCSRVLFTLISSESIEIGIGISNSIMFPRSRCLHVGATLFGNCLNMASAGEVFLRQYSTLWKAKSRKKKQKKVAFAWIFVRNWHRFWQKKLCCFISPWSLRLAAKIIIMAMTEKKINEYLVFYRVFLILFNLKRIVIAFDDWSVFT